MVTNNKLDIGDVIYTYSHYQKSNIIKNTIDRVTKTLAFSGENNQARKFKREVSSDGWVRTPGNDRWDSSIHRLATPKLDQQFIVSRQRRHLKSINWDKIPEPILKQFYDLLTKIKESQKKPISD